MGSVFSCKKRASSDSKESKKKSANKMAVVESVITNKQKSINEAIMQPLLVSIVASKAHDTWREEWRLNNGDIPRVKKTKDLEWVQMHNGLTEVDIASTLYADLPEDWKRENKSSALVAVDMVLAAVREDRLLNTEFLEFTSSIIHDEWLKRNGSWCDEYLKLPYLKLKPEDQDKDRIFVINSIDAFRNYSAKLDLGL